MILDTVTADSVYQVFKVLFELDTIFNLFLLLLMLLCNIFLVVKDCILLDFHRIKKIFVVLKGLLRALKYVDAG